MKFNPKTHIVGKVYALTQENMCLMLDEIGSLRQKISKLEKNQALDELTKETEDLGLTTFCKDCGVATIPGAGNARCSECWNSRFGES